MSARSRNKFNKSKLRNDEHLDISNEEFGRFKEALDKEEFRKLFFDYIEEIQDPANRKIYEDEITQLEKERGVHVRFVHPTPGFVVKTSLDGELKCFINIASSPEVEPPQSEVATNPEDGSRGLTWSIPMAQSGARDDVDAKNNLCKVFDVVFHPDALHLGTKNSQFRKCLIDTALDAVEREFQVSLDRTNLKYPKLDYKGISRPTVIRTLAENPTAEEQEPHPLEHMFPSKIPTANPEPRVLPMKKKAAPVPEFTVPKYDILHSHGVDLSEYTNELDAKLHVTMPRNLVVEIELPLLRSTAECQLDVTSKSVYLLSEKPGAKYRLKIDLPFVVDDKAGSARFDVDTRRLSITLPVVRTSVPEQREMHDTLRHFSREDSGVELHSNSESPVEEEEADGNLSDSKADTSETVTPIVTPVRAAPAPFLKSSVHYQLPAKFDCNVLDHVMAFVLHVPNVQPDSIRQLREQRSLHLQFATIGSGYYPTHYAFYVELPSEEDAAIESVEAEAWDNNVVLKLCLSAQSQSPQSYLAGLDANDLNEYPVHGQYKLKNKRRDGSKKESAPLDVKFDYNPDALEVNIGPATEEDEEEEEEGEPHEEPQHQQAGHNKKPNKKQRKKNKKERSLSESACEDVAVQEAAPEEVPAPEAKSLLKLPQRKQRSYSECNDSSVGSSGSHRGILKRFSRYGPRPSISDSCSSIDDCSSSYSCSVDASGASPFSQSFGGIPEEDRSDAGLSESCKKTVRFNDNIIKQTFRLDSSILGQRKKNQKRRDLKLRAQQRRLSEGDSVDYDETNANPLKGNRSSKGKLHDSGLDLTGAATAKGGLHDADAKNALMFEMDEDDDV
ncbi:hypothetical protein KR018_002911 [Drosophila ironensis]|nr:hypothetical protein KR018_002911 [Drosophila ironensis]